MAKRVTMADTIPIKGHVALPEDLPRRNEGS